MRINDTFVFDIWYFTGLSQEVKPGQMRRIEIAGHPINLGRRKDGQLFALYDICPHRAAPLSAGRIIGETVECPYHGWRFRQSDGQCTRIPSLCSNQKDISKRIKIRKFPVCEQGNLIWIYIANDPGFSGKPLVDPPSFPITRLRPRLIERLGLNCHVDHAVVGLMDPAHGPYVHRQWWWRSEKSIHEKAKRFEPRPYGFAMAAHTPSSNSFAYNILGGKPVTEISFTLPGIRTEEIRIGSKTLLSFTAMTPVSKNRTEIAQIFFSDHWFIRLFAPFLRSFVQTFLYQDSHMVNLQQQGLKYDPKLMLIEDADTQARWYYAMKKEWAKSRRENRPFKNPAKAKTLRWRS